MFAGSCCDKCQDWCSQADVVTSRLRQDWCSQAAVVTSRRRNHPEGIRGGNELETVRDLGQGLETRGHEAKIALIRSLHGASAGIRVWVENLA